MKTHGNPKLTKARERRGFSKRQLARLVGLSEGTIRNLEAGQIPRLDDARRLARVLRTSDRALWPEAA